MEIEGVIDPKVNFQVIWETILNIYGGNIVFSRGDKNENENCLSVRINCLVYLIFIKDARRINVGTYNLLFTYFKEGLAALFSIT